MQLLKLIDYLNYWMKFSHLNYNNYFPRYYFINVYLCYYDMFFLLLIIDCIFCSIINQSNFEWILLIYRYGIISASINWFKYWYTNLHLISESSDKFLTLFSMYNSYKLLFNIKNLWITYFPYLSKIYKIRFFYYILY